MRRFQVLFMDFNEDLIYEQIVEGEDIWQVTEQVKSIFGQAKEEHGHTPEQVGWVDVRAEG